MCGLSRGGEAGGRETDEQKRTRNERGREGGRGRGATGEGPGRGWGGSKGSKTRGMRRERRGEEREGAEKRRNFKEDEAGTGADYLRAERYDDYDLRRLERKWWVDV